MSGDAPIVDCHAHIFQADLPLSDRAWNRPSYGFSARQYLDLLDAHGVHFGIVAGISISGYYNDYMIDELRVNPRLRGTAILPPTTDRYTLDRMKADGVVGVRLQLARSKELPDLSTEDYRLFLRRIADLDWHVHVAVEGDRLEPVVAQLAASGVKIVIDHFGHPDPALAEKCPGLAVTLRSVEKGRTWVKMSGDYRLHDLMGEGAPLEPSGEALADRVAPILLAEVGPERLLWGSDAPFVGHEDRTSFAAALAAFERWVPDAGQRRQISRTALKLYFS
ncbi:amidohydrolase family protein [Sphingomonas sp. MMS24-J13]|uniref:amidohydrolase family protein n=1 Tax=Sphingomonas sp. MMS24-J13 TaxID=3238686 RepID=UPI00384CB849